HPVPAGWRQLRGREDDGGPDSERDRSVSERVERGERHRAATALLRRGDIAQGREVIPIEPVTEAERERGRDEAELQPGARRDHSTAHSSVVTPVGTSDPTRAVRLAAAIDLQPRA